LKYNTDFNIERNPNPEYYLHTITKNLKIKELSQIIGSFLNQRNNKSINDDLVIINTANIKEISFKNEEKDYYFSFLGCIFCRGKYKSFPALYIHMNFCHPEFESYYSVNFINLLNYKK